MQVLASLELSASSAGVALIDIQERLCAAMPAESLAATIRNAILLVEAARTLDLPLAVSEQYPRGLGATVPDLAAALRDFPADRLLRVDKTDFSCADVPAWWAFVERTGRSQWVLSGMECHVCVYQTARALAGRGLAVHVPRDAVVSRSAANWQTGLALAEKAGCVVTSTEAVIFDLLKRAGTDAFKHLSRLIK